MRKVLITVVLSALCGLFLLPPRLQPEPIRKAIRNVSSPVCRQCGGTDIRFHSVRVPGGVEDRSFLCLNRDCGYQWPAPKEPEWVVF